MGTPSVEYSACFVDSLRAYTGVGKRWSAVPRSPHFFDHAASLLEAAEHLDRGILSDAAVDGLLQDIVVSGLGDPGVCRQTDREAFKQSVPKNAAQVRPGSFQLRRFEVSLPTHEAEYFGNLRDELSRAEYGSWTPSSWKNRQNARDLVQPDELARLTASYLMKQGVSGTYLKNFAHFKLKNPATMGGACDVLDELENFSRTRCGEVEVLLVVLPGVSLPRPRPAGWLTIDETRSWLERQSRPAPGLAFAGGLQITVKAYDIYQAVEGIRITTERMGRLHRLSGLAPLRFHDEVYIRGVTRKQMFLSKSANNLGYGSLHKLTDVWSVEQSRNPLTDAVALLAASTNGEPAARASAMWSLVESLLLSPSDRRDRDTNNAAAAARASELLGAAWLRFESNLIFLEHVRSHPTAARSAIRVQGPAAVVGASISSNTALKVRESPFFNLAAHRLCFVGNNRATFRSAVVEHYATSLRFLYRHRNVFVHDNAASEWFTRRSLELCEPIVLAILDAFVRSGPFATVDTVPYAAEVSERLQRFLGGRIGPIDVLR
jgi:hypothetical protein